MNPIDYPIAITLKKAISGHYPKRIKEDSVMTRNDTDSTVRNLLEKYAPMGYGKIALGIYQMDSPGTHGDLTCIVEVQFNAVQAISYYPVEVRGENMGKVRDFIGRNNARFGNGHLAMHSGTSLIWFKTSANGTNSELSEDVIYTALNDNLITADLLLPAVVYICEDPEACVDVAMSMVETCVTEYITRSYDRPEDCVMFL